MFMGPGLRSDDSGGGPILTLEDVGGALVAGEEVRPLGLLDERLERFHPRQQADEVVLSAQCEDGVDQIMTDAGLALLDLQTVPEEIEDRLDDLPDLLDDPAALDLRGQLRLPA